MDNPRTIGELQHKNIFAYPQEHYRTIPINVKTGQGVLGPGTLLSKENANTFKGVVGTAGIDAEVATIPLKAGHSGALLANSTVRIGNEFIKVGAYDANGNQFTGCVRGYRGSTAAEHAADAEIAVVDAGANAEYHVIYDGLLPIACMLHADIDATSAAVKTFAVIDADVNKSALIAAEGAYIPVGFDKSSLLNIVEEV